MKKSISAFVAALLVTGMLAGVMFLIGQDAFGISSAKAEAATPSTALSTGAAARYEQLVAQYQAREAQYQDQIAQATQQINTANEQLQQYQSLLQQLQDTGLITIASDGSITVNQPSQPGFFEHHGGGH